MNRYTENPPGINLNCPSSEKRVLYIGMYAGLQKTVVSVLFSTSEYKPAARCWSRKITLLVYFLIYSFLQRTTSVTFQENSRKRRACTESERRLKYSDRLAQRKHLRVHTILRFK